MLYCTYFYERRESCESGAWWDLGMDYRRPGRRVVGKQADWWRRLWPCRRSTAWASRRLHRWSAVLGTRGRRVGWAPREHRNSHRWSDDPDRAGTTVPPTLIYLIVAEPTA